MSVPPGSVRITFLGDTLVGGEAQPLLDVQGPGTVFEGIRHLFAGSDLVVANQEGPITRREVPERKLDTGRKRYWYRAQPESVAALTDAGIRVVGLANNHVLDFGPDGLTDTIRALDDAGIAHCGAGADRAAARRPATIEVRGLRLGFLSLMQRYDLYVAERLYASSSEPGPMRLGRHRARRDLERLAGDADVRIVLAHWGRNYKRRNPRQVSLARSLVEAGADLVIGHHPHVPQPIAVVGSALVCYSLGNGPLGTPGRFHSGRLPYGLVVTVDVDGRGVLSRVAVESILVDNAQIAFRPRVADDSEARRHLRRLLPRGVEWCEQPGEGLVADLTGLACASPPPADRVGSASED